MYLFWGICGIIQGNSSQEQLLGDHFSYKVTELQSVIYVNKAPTYPNPWIWRENQRGVLIGFSYSEIRFLNKNIVKYLKINAIFRQSIYFFQLFFVLQHYR